MAGVQPGGDQADARAPLSSTAPPAPGSPPPGVSLETTRGATRIVIGGPVTTSRLAALAWVLAPLTLGLLAYRVEPRAAYLAAGAAAGIALLLLVQIARERQLAAGAPAICLDAERIWIERSEEVTADWIKPTPPLFADAPQPEAPSESLPLESMPRRSVEFVRVDSCQPLGADSRDTPLPRLLIEANAGRLEYVGAPSDGRRLEWVRDYLRYRLSQAD